MCLLTPAEFSAVQVYSPACSAFTESMLSWLVRLLVRMTVTPSILDTGTPFSIHVIFNGKSPLCTAHIIVVMSSELIGSVPKSKGIIAGGTVKKVIKKECRKKLKIKKVASYRSREGKPYC